MVENAPGYTIDFHFAIQGDSMRLLRSQGLIHLSFLAFIAAAITVVMTPDLLAGISLPDPSLIQPFKTMFIGIVLEALPFILLGVIVSAFLHLFVSEQAIRRFVPKSPLLGIPFACVLGVLFPVCECGLIPVVRRLMAKGMPLYIGVVFLAAGPIVNPVVYLATYTAFRSRPDMLYARMGLALLIGIAIGLIVFFFVKSNPLRTEKHGPDHHHHHTGGKLTGMMEHAGSEFFEMGKYLMIGALLTAAIQTAVPRASLAEIGQHEAFSYFFMMAFAYVLSLCSTADAFVASSFAGTFTSGSLLAFLVLGPMLDFKTSLMLLAVFKRRFVLQLASALVVLVLAGCLLAERLYLL